MKQESVDLFGQKILDKQNSFSIERTLLQVFKGKILTQTEINLLPKSIKDIK